jgi:acyl carrier protein
MPTSSKRALTREQVHEVLWNLAAQQTDKEVGNIRPGHKLIQDLGADSLDMAELTMELEERLGIELPKEVTEKSDLTMGEIEEAICKHCV